MHNQNNMHGVSLANKNNNFLKDYADQVEELQNLMLGAPGQTVVPRKGTHGDTRNAGESGLHRQVYTETGRPDHGVTNVDGSVNVCLPAQHQKQGLISKLAKMRKKVAQIDQQADTKDNERTRQPSSAYINH